MTALAHLAALAGMTTRSMTAAGDRRAITLQRDYRYSVDDVWSAWTDPQRLARWLGEVRGQPSVGATVQLCMSPSDSDIATVTILACQSPTRLVVRWAWPDEDDSYVDLRLRPTGDERCTLTLSHAALSEATGVQYGSGWDDFLLRVDRHLNGDDAPQSSGKSSAQSNVTPLWTAPAAQPDADDRWPIVVDGPTSSVLRSAIVLGHPPASVWRAVTDADAVSSWFGRLSGDLAVGGAYTMTFDAPEGASASGQVLECVPATRLVVTWRWSHQDFDTRVSVDLTAVPGGTRVQVEQSDVVGPVFGYAAGWSAYLLALGRSMDGDDRSEVLWQAEWSMAQAMATRLPGAQ